MESMAAEDACTATHIPGTTTLAQAPSSIHPQRSNVALSLDQAVRSVPGRAIHPRMGRSSHWQEDSLVTLLRSELMIGAGFNKAEIEYAVTLAVLNFETEFMKSSYSRVQVQVFDKLIEVILSRSAPIPAEEELAKSPRGRNLLRQFHQALFDSCQELLRKKIERAIGGQVEAIISDFNLTSGKTTLIIRRKCLTETF